MTEIVVRRCTALASPATDVWAFAVTEAGIAYELGPWVRMTMPRMLRGASIADVPVGKPLGRAWLLLGQVMPFDYDDLMIAELGPGMRFLERSRLGSARHWQHERVVAPTDEGSCELTDVLTLVPRRPLAWLGLTPVVRWIVEAIFDHRHRRLARRWGRARLSGAGLPG
jgi:hypothetical protein